mgnify:CR=1 FL=1
MILNPNMAATRPSPVVEAKRWIADKTFSPDLPLLNVSQAAPVDPPPRALREAMADVALTLPAAHVYGPVLGLPALREALAARFSQAYGGPITPGNVAITQGCNQAFCAALSTLAGPGDEVILPSDAEAREELLYRRTRVECATVQSLTTVAGTSLRGEKGLAQRATCLLADGTTARVDIGFSRRPEPVEWDGGSVVGTIAPGWRIVATEPLAGLEPLAAPDPRDLPNNHLAYAGQWFFFALTALVIYILALRRRSTRARAD